MIWPAQMFNQSSSGSSSLLDFILSYYVYTLFIYIALFFYYYLYTLIFFLDGIEKCTRQMWVCSYVNGRFFLVSLASNYKCAWRWTYETRLGLPDASNAKLSIRHQLRTEKDLNINDNCASFILIHSHSPWQLFGIFNFELRQSI